MTNELLRKNAEKLKLATVETVKESERGIVDIETLKATNESLISTLDEVMKIQEDGRQKRAAAEVELVQLENDIKKKMLELSAGGSTDTFCILYEKKRRNRFFCGFSVFYVLSYPYLGRSAFSFFLRYSVK